MPQIITKINTFLKVIERVTSSSYYGSITLIICTTKPEFLEDLRFSVTSWRPPRDEIPASQEDEEGEELTNHTNSSPPLSNISPSRVPPTTSTRNATGRPTSSSSATAIDNLSTTTFTQPQHQQQPHPLLIPTLHLLSTSSNVKLIFCSTIPTFRAYISTFSPHTLLPTTITSPVNPNQPTSTSPQQRHNLLILNTLSLHHSTSEFTFQGLSRTFASIASTAHRTGCNLELIECRDSREADRTATMATATEGKGPELWEAEVVLLSGGVKIAAGAGAGQGGGVDIGWGVGRTVKVRKVVGRWFDFDDE